MSVNVTLKIDDGYSDISSGIVSFENTRTGTKVSIRAPEDLKSDIYRIQSITMDTGAGCTILPEKFAQIIDIERPTGKLNRRLRLEVDVGEMMDYILIDRDWQKSFKLTFGSETLYVQTTNIF